MYKVSVCVATYNGELHIRQQLDSILSQIGIDDEVVVFDDCSTDATYDILKSYQSSDQRLKVFRNVTNIGHVKNFERALKNSFGDIIILSDQDDIWSNDKYREVIQILEHDQSVAMVYHALKKIDSCGHAIDPSTSFSNRQIRVDRMRFILVQFFSFKVFGCSMAFRRQNINLALPFPRFLTYAHDHWITILSALNSGVIYYDKPLTNYRQHNYNVTPKHGLGICDKLKVRLYLLALTLIAIIRVIKNRIAVK